jgi:hypothetical protein
MCANDGDEDSRKKNDQMMGAGAYRRENMLTLIRMILGGPSMPASLVVPETPRPVPAWHACEEETFGEAVDRRKREIGASWVSSAVPSELPAIWEETSDEFWNGTLGSRERASVSLCMLPHGLGPWLAACDENLWTTYEVVLNSIEFETECVRELLGGTYMTLLGGRPLSEEDRMGASNRHIGEALRRAADVAASYGELELAKAFSNRAKNLTHEGVTPLKLLTWTRELESFCTNVREMLEEEDDSLEEEAKASLLEEGYAI